jgi:hypothetical protein
VVFRPGTIADTPVVLEVFLESIVDLGHRLEPPPAPSPGSTPADAAAVEAAEIARFREERLPLFEHLARTAARCWIAEKDGRAVAYARAIRRSGMDELTELFVRPATQSGGLGRELLARAFPAEGAGTRVIVASPDVRAQALYFRAGLVTRFPVAYFSRRPERVEPFPDLEFEAVVPGRESFEVLASIDAAVLGHRRDEDHLWLLRDKTGFFCVRDGRPVGYGYTGGGRCGPVAMLEEGDFPAALAHAETLASEQLARVAAARPAGAAPLTAEDEELGLDVPLPNRAAVAHLLARGFRMSPHHMLFLSDRPFGSFERYACMSPTFFF